MDADDNSHQLLPAEWHKHTRTHYRHVPVHGVGEGLVERDGKGNIAEGGHPPSEYRARLLSVPTKVFLPVYCTINTTYCVCSPPAHETFGSAYGMVF
jgi:hypothetical protein